MNLKNVLLYFLNLHYLLQEEYPHPYIYIESSTLKPPNLHFLFLVTQLTIFNKLTIFRYPKKQLEWAPKGNHASII